MASDRFQGRVAAVTGGARGIGLAVAERISAEGGRVALWDVDLAEAEKVAARLGGAAVKVDVADDASVSAAVSATEAAALLCDAVLAWIARIMSVTESLFEVM